MAIKVGGTTVIDDSRNITPVNSTVSNTLTIQKVVETAVSLGTVTTAATINLFAGTLFTATLGGNCTFTITNPTGAASFTLILTNDGTPSRTVAWAASGGSFKFPGGAAGLTRTTAASGIDVWTFFSPDGGTNWYGNISQKAHAA